jgi:hypothetical protein
MVLAGIVRGSLSVAGLCAGLWIGWYAGHSMGGLFQELYRPFALDFAALDSHTDIAIALMTVLFGGCLAFLGCWLGRRIPLAAAFIGIGVGLYVGLRSGGVIGGLYAPYAVSEDALDWAYGAAILGMSVLWVLALAIGGYLFGRRLELWLGSH